MSTPLLRIVVTDANVLINLMHVSRLGLLANIPNHEFVVPDHVREEITIPEQRVTLDAAVSEGWLKIEVINDLGAITVFTELIEHLDRGEAACIAVAAQKGWLVASDEKKRFLREAIARVGAGHVLTTVDVFVLAIKAGLLTKVPVFPLLIPSLRASHENAEHVFERMLWMSPPVDHVVPCMGALAKLLHDEPEKMPTCCSA